MMKRRDARGRIGLGLAREEDGKKVEESKINRLEGDKTRQQC